MKQKHRFVVQITILMAIPAFFYFVILDAVIYWIGTLGIMVDFETLHGLLISMVFPVLTYMGLLFVNKNIVTLVSMKTARPVVLKSVTVATTLLAMIFITYQIDVRNQGISKNDLGIGFEIVGFLIFLSPIKEYFQKWITEDSDDKFVYYDIIRKTTAVTLVMLGLLYQLSHFS